MKSSNFIIPPLLIAFASFGASMSIGKYGIFVPLMVVLILFVTYDTTTHKHPHINSCKDVKLYACYIVVFWLCSMCNGDGDFGRNSLTVSYIISILIFYYLSFNINTARKLQIITNVIITILFFNCLITIAQYHNNALGWGTWYIFNDAETVSQAQLVEKLNGSKAQMIGSDHAFCPGIFPSQVLNGYILASLGIIALFEALKSQRFVYRVVHSVIVASVLYALFVAQQRMAFFLFMIACVCINFTKYKYQTIIFAAIAATYFLTSEIDLSEDTIGRFANVEDKTREKLYETGINYIADHWLYGGRKAYLLINDLSIHNVFLNSFLYGGVMGAILICIIYVRMCIRCLKIILRNFSHPICPTVAFAYALLIYNLISLTHNNSLLTGDPIIWVLYALMLISSQFNNETKSKKKMYSLDYGVR